MCRVFPALRRREIIFDKLWFENKFTAEDPWGYAASRYEEIKYGRQIEAIRLFLPQPRHILEVGCAEGRHTEMLAKAFPEASIHGVDISSRALSRAQTLCASYPNITLVQGDILYLLKDSTLPRSGFDVIIQSESLYYLFPKLMLRLYLINYIRGLIDKLRRNGLFVTSNGLTIQTRFALPLIYSTLKTFTKKVYGRHYRDWSEHQKRFLTYDINLFRLTH